MKKRLIVLISLTLLFAFVMAACVPGEIKPKGEKMNDLQTAEYYEELSKKLEDKENVLPTDIWYKESMHFTMEMRNEENKDSFVTMEMSLNGKHLRTPFAYDEKYTYDFSIKVVNSSKEEGEKAEVATTTMRGKYFKVEGAIYAEITMKVDGNGTKIETKAKLNENGFGDIAKYLQTLSNGSDLSGLSSGMYLDPQLLIESLTEEGEFYKFKNGFSATMESGYEEEPVDGAAPANKMKAVQVVEFDKDMNVASVSEYGAFEMSAVTYKIKTVMGIEIKKTSIGANVKTPKKLYEYESDFSFVM
ncbi:MAG: hypothetical protein J6U35_03605 [Clostridia bacterium]|nr:hypothetical protein [Clostridia bacterium]